MLSVPDARGIPRTTDETRRTATVEALRGVARNNFAGYDPRIHGMGVLTR